MSKLDRYAAIASALIAPWIVLFNVGRFEVVAVALLSILVIVLVKIAPVQR